MALFNPPNARQRRDDYPGDTFEADPVFDLDSLTLQQLLKLRSEVEKRLPVKDLREINLARELILQHQASLELQNRVLQSTETPANQVAQTMNSTAAVLQQLVKLQETVYSTERLKHIEACLVEALNTLPAEQQRAFLCVYEGILAADKREGLA